MGYSKKLIWAHLGLCFIFGTFLLIAIFKLHRSDIKNKIMYKQRYPKTVVIGAITTAILLLIIWPFMYCVDGIFGDSSFYKTSHLLSQIIYPPFSFFCIYCVVYRYWMLMYDFHVLTANSDMKWKQIIDCCANVNKEEWLLRNHKTVGNASYMAKLGIIKAEIFAIICVIFKILAFYNYISLRFSILFESLYYAANGIALFIIRYHSPKFGDSLHISCELKFITKAYLFCFILFIISIILENGFGLNKYGLNSFVGIFTFFLLGFIPTLHILTLNHCECHSNNGKCNNEMKENFKKEVDDMLRKHLLKDTLNNFDYYVMFMHHLMSELSMECLLSFTEFLQFKQYALQKYTNTNEDSNNSNEGDNGLPILHPKDTSTTISITGDSQEPLSPTKSLPQQQNLYELHKLSTLSSRSGTNRDTIIDINNNKIKLGKNIPKSNIVYHWCDGDNKFDNNLEKELKMKSYKLFLKYIQHGSKYEINISYNQRHKFDNLMKNEDEWLKNEEYSVSDIIYIFDDVTKEMFKLMNDAHSRFKNSDEFNNVLTTLVYKRNSMHSHMIKPIMK